MATPKCLEVCTARLFALKLLKALGTRGRRNRAVVRMKTEEIHQWHNRRESQPRSVGHESIDGTLSGAVLQSNLTSELDQLHRDKPWLPQTGRSSKTLVKYPDLRIVLIAMKANTRMHEHTAAGRISVHTLNGHIRIHLPERVVDLPAGNLLALDQCVSHDVEASEDSVFLLTLSWPLEAKIAEAKPRGKEITRPKRK